MKFDRRSLAYRLLVPVFGVVVLVSLVLLVLVSFITSHILDEYIRTSLSSYNAECQRILDTSLAELSTARLLENRVVVEVKRRTAIEELSLAWRSRGVEGIVIGQDGKPLYSSLPQDVTAAVLAVPADGHFHVEFDDRELHGQGFRFPAWEWRIITLTHSLPTQPTRKEVLTLVPIVGIGSVLMLTLLFILLRRRLQRPVASMVSQVSSGGTVERTGVSEFDRLGASINDALEQVRARSLELERELNERRRAEASVREKEEHIRMLLASMAEGIYGVDVSGVCTFCNPACVQMLGYEQESDLLGRNIHELIHYRRADGSDYPEEDCRIYRAYREQRGVHVDDEVFLRRDGTSIPVEYWSYPVVEHGSVTGAVVTFLDISERVRSETFIRNILETVDEGFLIIDRNYTILSANRAYGRQAGVPLEEIIGRKCHEISHKRAVPCDGSGDECSARKTMETGKPCSGVHMHHGSGDSELRTEIKTYPVRDNRGDVVSVIMTTTDITEKSRLELQLSQAQKMEAVGQLAGGVAHDFNNVLTAIVGYASLMKKQAAEGSQALFFADQILASASRAANLTRQILAFSRKQVIQVRPTNLNDIIRSMEKFLARLLGEDIEIRTSLTGHDVTAMVDPGQMEQVVMNLATNARDAMPSGGLLAIRTEVIEVDTAAASASGLERPGRYALLTVSDSGTGMDERTRERIFEPFYTTKEMGRGTGLGLAIVFGIVKQHKGHIAVYSEPGKGTTFRTYLPLTDAAMAEPQAPAAAAVRGGTETILLAEDDPDVRGFMKLVLEDHGYTVELAVDGNEAVSVFRERKDDIALCLFDVIMPKKNGKAALREIRAIRADVKAIFMSGYAADIIREKDLMEENLVLLNKPILPQDLLRRVREVLDA